MLINVLFLTAGCSELRQSEPTAKFRFSRGALLILAFLEDRTLIVGAICDLNGFSRLWGLLGLSFTRLVLMRKSTIYDNDLAAISVAVRLPSKGGHHGDKSLRRTVNSRLVANF